MSTKRTQMADRIMSRMMDLDMSASQLGRLTGMTHAAFTSWFALDGTTFPRVDSLWKVCRALDRPIEWAIDGRLPKSDAEVSQQLGLADWSVTDRAAFLSVCDTIARIPETDRPAFLSAILAVANITAPAPAPARTHADH